MLSLIGMDRMTKPLWSRKVVRSSVPTICVLIRPGGGAHVANVGYMILPAAIGRGIGRRIVQHSLQRARERGFKAIQFNFVVSTNARAVHLYRSFGFDTIGRLPLAFRHPTPGFVDVLGDVQNSLEASSHEQVCHSHRQDIQETVDLQSYREACDEPNHWRRSNAGPCVLSANTGPAQPACSILQQPQTPVRVAIHDSSTLMICFLGLFQAPVKIWLSTFLNND